MHMSWWECTWWAFHSCCPITIAYVDVPKCSERTHPPCTKARDTSRWVTMIKVSAVVPYVTWLFSFTLVRAWSWKDKVWMTDCNVVLLIIHIQRIYPTKHWNLIKMYHESIKLSKHLSSKNLKELSNSVPRSCIYLLKQVVLLWLWEAGSYLTLFVVLYFEAQLYPMY